MILLIKRIIKKTLYYFLQGYCYVRDSSYNNTILLVYSMGKVGSTSVYYELRKRLPATTIFHLHFLSDYWLKEKLPEGNRYFHSNIRQGNDILNYIRNQPKKRIKVITLVREPIMRDISDLFENWRSQYENIENLDRKVLFQIMEESSHEYTLNWFDSEFKNYLGFNIYDVPFNKESGYKIYNLENADILCLKLEVLDKIAPKAFEEFLGLKLNFKNQNISSEKIGKELYKEIKNNYKADKNKLLNLYDSPYVKHFYTEEEINDFISKWS